MEERKIIILGSGVAGLTAAIYAARAELKPLILTGFEDGGQIATTTLVENFPGFPEGIMGPDLVANMKKQAEKFGAEVRMEQANEFIINDDGTYTIRTDFRDYKAEALIIATGASAKWLGLENESQFKSRGVHTCATCDAAFYKDKKVILVGGGDAACEEADFLTKYASKVIMLVRRNVMRASKPMRARVKNNEKIEIRYNSQIKEYLGSVEEGLTGVIIHDSEKNEDYEEKVDGVFLAIGHTPNTSIFEGKLELDEKKYLKADDLTRTNLPGVFAAGDVADHVFQQAITAAGKGAAAAIMAEKYLAEKNSKQ